MSDVTIDKLSIEITSNSTGAAQGIDALADSLGKLKTNGSVGVACKNLERLSDALKKLTPVTSNANKLAALADSITKLANAGSMTKVINQLEKLPGAVRGLSGLNVDNSLGDKLKSLASALSPLANVKAGGIGTIANALTKLQKIDLDKIKFDDTKIKNFVAEIKKLDNAIGPLSTKMVNIGAAFRAVNSSATSAGNGMSHFGKKVNVTTLNLSSLITVVQGAINALMPLVRLLSDAVGQAIEWDGIAARFGRAFGDQADEVYSWIQRLNEEMGINIQQFMQYSSLNASMLQGFGVASEDAYKMALGYTELTYDIWAGFNDKYKSFQDAADAISSAIAGEVEPIRRAGLTITEATLQETAANHGLAVSLENATEAQKSYLRYLAITDAAMAQGLVGTYARELNTAEGMMRTFRQQLSSLAQAFGSLFLPILVKIMPWLQAFIELLTEAIHRVAAFFGITIQDISGTWGSVGGGSMALEDVGNAANTATDSLGDTADAVDKTTNALKDLKRATIGIDELNVISPPTSSGSSGSGGSGSGGTDVGDVGGGLGAFEGLDVDSLWDESIFDQIQFEVDKIIGTLKESLSAITAVISGFMLAIGTILVVSGANIPLGLGLMAVGAIGLVAVIAENWNGMSEQLAKTLTTITAVLGGFLLAIGAFLVFSGVNVGLGAALMVAGAVSLGTAVAINWKFLEGDLKNTLSILTGVVAGGLLAMGALFAFTGVDVPLGIALMAAGAVGLVTAAGLNWDCMSEPLRKAIGTLEAIVGSSLLTLGAILTFSGANIPLGVGLMAAGAVSLVSATALNWDSMTGDMRNTIATITALVSGALIGVGAVLTFTGVAAPIGIAMMAAGAVGIIASAAINWSWITEKVKTVLKEIGAVLGISLLAVGALLLFTGVAAPLGIGLMAAGAVSLGSSIALNWGWLTEKVDGIVSDVGDAWDGLWGACKSGVKKMWDGVVEWFWNLWDTLVGHSIVPDTIDAIVKYFTGMPGRILGTVAKFVKDIIAKFSEFKVVQIAVSLFKKGWSTVKGWIGSIPGVSQAVSLAKKGWSTIKKWIGNIPGLSQAISLVKSGWSSVKKWIGNIPKLDQAISLAKKGWRTVKSWIGSMPTLSAKIKLVKSGWSTIKKWLGNLDFKLNFKLPKIKVNWGSKTVAGFTIKYPSGFSTYAKGGFPDLGELFVAREAGPEMVGRIGNKTTVANNDQIVEGISEGVYSAVLAAMRQSESGGNRTINVMLPDGRVLASAVEKTQRERGASLMGSQVYAY